MRKFGAVGVLALGIALALWGCGSEKGAETPVEETHYPTRAACDERGWTQDFGPIYWNGRLLDTCLALLYHEFIEDSEWEPGYKPNPSNNIVSTMVDWVGIRKISPKVKNLYYLEQISIWGSDSLKSIPPEIYSPDSLATIYVQLARKLQVISEPIAGTVSKKLDFIKIYRAPLAEFEDGFWSLPIESLVLDSMGLTEFPMNTLRIKGLKLLELDGNQMDSIPEAVYAMDSLKSLGVGRNQLSSLPAWVCTRTDVRWTVGFNRICDSPDSLWSCIGYSEKSIYQNCQNGGN